jgi:transcriptional regulator with XRE-family HTH domain
MGYNCKQLKVTNVNCIMITFVKSVFDMEDRLLKLLDVEQLSSSKFADVISVQRSSVSHILSGRNKPSFDFLQKTLKAFPLLNADWLILGEGKMYESGDFGGGGSLFSQPEPNSANIPAETEAKEEITTDIPTSESSISPVIDAVTEEIPSEQTKIPELETSSVLSTKKVVKVILLYGDNSFDSYNPGD